MSDAPPTLASMPFWFLRHGQTDWNKNDLAQGLTDVPLNQTGLDQAASAAAVLVGRGIRAVVCSPLIRARVTADIVAAVIGAPVFENPMLHEAAFGSKEGQKMLAPWFTDWIDGVTTPEGAEPFAAVIRRAIVAVNQALAEHPGPVLIIAHGALFRALRAAMGLAPNQRLMNAVPQYCTPGAGHDPWRLANADSATELSHL